MPTTDKNFFIEHHAELQEILNKYNITKCILGNFQSFELRIMFGVEQAKRFYMFKKDLQKIANKYECVFAMSFSAFSAAGQKIPVPDDAVEFKSLRERNEIIHTINDPLLSIAGQFSPKTTVDEEKSLDPKNKISQDLISLKELAKNYRENNFLYNSMVRKEDDNSMHNVSFNANSYKPCMTPPRSEIIFLQ